MKSFDQPTPSIDRFGNPLITYNFAIAGKRRNKKQKEVLKKESIVYDGNIKDELDLPN